MVNHTAPESKMPAVRCDRAGFFALLRVAAGAQISRSSLLGLSVACALALLAPAVASAAFTRPLLRQITGSANGPFTPPQTVAPGHEAHEPFGLAVGAEDHLWLGEQSRLLTGPTEKSAEPATRLDGFASAASGNAFLGSLSIGAPIVPEAVATEAPTGRFYVVGKPANANLGVEDRVEAFAGAGSFLERWPAAFQEAHLAVDNSTNSVVDPSACAPECSVYVSHARDSHPPTGDGLPTGIAKLNDKGEPRAFVNGKGEPVSFPYVTGGEITGTPAGPGGCEEFQQGSGSAGGLGAVAVDPEGDIYVALQQCHTNQPGVLEYRPSGEFVRIFTGGETPGLGAENPSHEFDGFGGQLSGLAVDPVSGDLLVAVASTTRRESVIDEFDPASGRYVSHIVETTPGARLGETSEQYQDTNVTIDSQGALYFVDRAHGAVDVFGAGHFLPSLTVAEAANRAPTSAELVGAVNPEGLKLTDCHFQYTSEQAFQKEGFASAATASCAPEASAIPPDSSEHPVHAVIGGLTSGTTYRYRLLATSEGALGGTATTGTLAFTAPHPPAIVSSAASSLSSTFADLQAQINPLGAATKYLFEYVDAAHYDPAAQDPYAAGATAPAGGAFVDIGAGEPAGSSIASVLQHIGGLASATTYHFRVIAENTIDGSLESTSGPDGTFSTLPPSMPGLPDGRAYELVTPPNKGSAEDMFAALIKGHEVHNNDVAYPSATGNQLLLETNGAFGPFAASSHNVYVFTRNAPRAQWETTPLASPALGVQGISNPLFDPADLSRVAFGDAVGSLASATGQASTALAGPPAGPYVRLHADPPRFSLHEAPGAVTQVVGASRDTSHLILESSDHTLAPGAEAQDEHSRDLYEWAGGGECPSNSTEASGCALVNVDSEGALLSRCGATLGYSPENRHSAVSADGSRVLFTAPDPVAKNRGPGCWNGALSNPPQLYMRLHGQTLELSAPEEGWTPEGPTEPAAYVGAAEDGSKVFFATKTELTRDDAGIHDLELYECEILEPEPGATRCSLSRISAGESHTSAGSLQTVPAISADGSAVYFMAWGALAPGAQLLERPARNQGLRLPVNLYRYDTTTRTTQYVGEVMSDDAPDNSTSEESSWFSGNEWSAFPLNKMSWYTTPDGRYLLFATTSEIRPHYSTVGPCQESTGSANGHGDGHCEELYRYDSRLPISEGVPGVTDNPVCVSCNPSGAPPTSDSLFSRSPLQTSNAGQVAGAISDDGSYVFFDTLDALVPQDENNTLDVYEWHEGRVSLISSGHDPSPSFFLGASPDGANVFFGTHARLVPQDTDNAGDIYDARICTTADPCIQPPGGETAQCLGGSCQTPPPAPNDASPVSLTFTGSGDLAPPPEGKPSAERKSLTNAQKLARALKACRKLKNKQARPRCARQARKRYVAKAGRAGTRRGASR